ncbi:MAG: outer membrane lipoprotein carrier protein LolA [Burkholderiales bacterium]|nr:outer membrane lipoprotein carrier protein LolA [Burkholderiales bacterium]
MPTLPPPPPTRRRTDRRGALARLAALAAVLALPARGRADATAFDLARLMQLLGQVKSGEATFVETRTVAMLDRPLESSGRLWFEAPDTFVRETLKPRRERMAIVGDTLTMSLGNRSRTVPLDAVPEAAVILEAIRGTLTGNREALERHFSATVSGGPQRWSLELVPLDARLLAQVNSVRVAGRQAAVREVTVTMADGDRSLMRIEPAAPPNEPPAPVAKPASAAG